jgi:hypothetical protein
MSSGDTATPDGFHALHAANSFYQFYLLVQRFLKFESYGWSFRGEIIGRRPMIENRNPGITVAGYWIPGSPASLRRPGMTKWIFQGTQQLCSRLIDQTAVATKTKGKRRGRSTAAIGRRGRRPRHLHWAIATVLRSTSAVAPIRRDGRRRRQPVPLRGYIGVSGGQRRVGGGCRETVSSGGTALGTTLLASAQLRVSTGGVAISTAEIGTERAMRDAIPPGGAGAIRVTSG